MKTTFIYTVSLLGMNLKELDEERLTCKGTIRSSIQRSYLEQQKKVNNKFFDGTRTRTGSISGSGTG